MIPLIGVLLLAVAAVMYFWPKRSNSAKSRRPAKPVAMRPNATGRWRERAAPHTETTEGMQQLREIIGEFGILLDDIGIHREAIEKLRKEADQRLQELDARREALDRHENELNTRGKDIERLSESLDKERESLRTTEQELARRKEDLDAREKDFAECEKVLAAASNRIRREAVEEESPAPCAPQESVEPHAVASVLLPEDDL